MNPDLTAEFTVDLPFEAYYVKEIATDEHYIPNVLTFPVEFQYAGQKIDVITIEINNGDGIVNTFKRGEVQSKHSFVANRLFEIPFTELLDSAKLTVSATAIFRRCRCLNLLT